MMEIKVVVRVPRAVSRHTAHRRVLLDALKVHVEQKHEYVANFWGTRLQNKKRAGKLASYITGKVLAPRAFVKSKGSND
jgi:hypothetical protein